MYMTGRSRRARTGRYAEASARAVETASRASALTRMTIFTWSTLLSDDTGTLYWTSRVDHLDELVRADETLSGSEDFMSWVNSSDELFVGELSDVVFEVISGAPTAPPAPYVMNIRGVAAPGALAEAVATGVELAETATRLTGNLTSFLMPVVGPYGGVAWTTQLPDLRALESAQATLRASDEWLKLADRAGHAYQPGITTSLMQRLS
jgi:hypothetical protein